MSRFWIILFAGALSLTACHDSVAPVRPSGRYAFTGYFLSSTWTPSTPAQYPLPGYSTIPIDSVHDTLVVQSDGTYQEEGGVWGLVSNGSASSPYIAPLDVHGTYVVHSSGFTLLPNSGALVDSSTATVYGDTLTIVRYPGTWKFARF